MTNNLKSIRQQFRDSGVFYSTDEIANILKNYVDVDTHEVYDPTAGDGALLAVWSDNIAKYGQEINKSQLDIATTRLINFNGYCGDTLTNPNREWLNKKFKCIVANPPFSIKWEPKLVNDNDPRFNLVPALPPQSKADYAFILHILHHLADDGVAVVLNYPGILYRGNSEGKIRQWIVENNYIDKVIRIAGNKFIDTKIETAIIVFKKNKLTTDITFIDNETSQSVVATIEEVKQNGYNLSVSSYIVKEEVKEEIDIVNLNIQLEDIEIENIKISMEQKRMVYETFGDGDFNRYLNKLQNVINKFR